MRDTVLKRATELLAGGGKSHPVMLKKRLNAALSELRSAAGTHGRGQRICLWCVRRSWRNRIHENEAVFLCPPGNIWFCGSSSERRRAALVVRGVSPLCTAAAAIIPPSHRICRRIRGGPHGGGRGLYPKIQIWGELWQRSRKEKATTITAHAALPHGVTGTRTLFRKVTSQGLSGWEQLGRAYLRR